MLLTCREATARAQRTPCSWMRPADWISVLDQEQLSQVKELTMISLKKGILVSRSRVTPCSSEEPDGAGRGLHSPAGLHPHTAPSYSPQLRPPTGLTPPAHPYTSPHRPPFRPHVAVAVHAQGLDLRRLLLAILGAEGPEQGSPPSTGRLHRA